MLQVAPCVIFGMERDDLQPSQQAVFCIPSIPPDILWFQFTKSFTFFPLKNSQGLAVFSLSYYDKTKN